jgi:Zn-dependent protease
MNLLNAVFSLVPVQPIDGLDIRVWNWIVRAVVFHPLPIYYLNISMVLLR